MKSVTVATLVFLNIGMALGQGKSPVGNLTIKPPAKIAVLASPNLSSDKWEDVKRQESQAARERVEELFKERGYAAIPDAETDAAVSSKGIELTNEEHWSRKNMLEVGRAVKADLIAFVVIRQTRTKTIGNILLKRGAGEAQVEVWLLEVATGTAVLDDVAIKGQKLAPPPGATGLRLGAVRNSIDNALKETLKPYAIQKESSH